MSEEGKRKLVYRKAKWLVRYVMRSPNPAEEIAHYEAGVHFGERLLRDGKAQEMSALWLSRVEVQTKRLLLKQMAAVKRKEKRDEHK